MNRVELAALFVPLLVLGLLLTPIAIQAGGAGPVSAGAGEGPSHDEVDVSGAEPAGGPSLEATLRCEADTAAERAAPTDAEIDEQLQFWEQLVYANQDPDVILPEPGTGDLMSTVGNPRSPLAQALVALLPEGFVVHEELAQDPSQYSAAFVDSPDGSRVEATLYGAVLVDAQATLCAEPVQEAGTWQGVGQWVLPRYGTIGRQRSGPVQVLVALDDGSLLNITWRVRHGAGAPAGRAALDATRALATRLVG